MITMHFNRKIHNGLLQGLTLRDKITFIDKTAMKNWLKGVYKYCFDFDVKVIQVIEG
jgi:hypothetical protein